MSTRTGTLAPPYRALTVGMLVLVALIAFEAIAVTTAMPTVVESLDGLKLYGLAFGGTMAAGIVGTTVGGGWADARGPAAPLWAGIAGFVAGLLLAGFAPTMELLIAGRVVQGFGGGLATVALYVVVGQVYPEELHSKVFAAFAGAWLLPSLAGPAIAGFLVSLAGWRWVFLAVAFPTIVAALMVRPHMKGLDSYEGDGFKQGGRVLLALGVAAGAVMLHFGGQLHGVQAYLLMGLALAGLAATAPRLLPKGTFKVVPGIPSVVVLRSLMGSAFALADVFIPLLLTRERGFSPAAAGITLTVGAVGWVSGSNVQSRWGDRFTDTARLRLGAALTAAGIGTAALTVIPSFPIALLLVGWTAGGFGMGFSFPTMSSLVLKLSAPNEQGANSSAMQLGDMLFSTTVLALGGTLFAAWVGSSAPAAFLAAFLIAEVLAVLAVLVVPRIRAGRTAPVVAEPETLPLAA